MSEAFHSCCTLPSDSRFVTKGDKLRIRSKYLIGSCAVHIVYMESAANAWTDTRRANARKKVVAGLDILRNYKHMKTGAASAISFQTSVSEETVSRSVWDPLDGWEKNDLLQRNMRQFLKDKGFYKGVVDTTSGGWSDNPLCQALWEFNNDQRERLKTDWAILIVVVPNPKHPDNGGADKRTTGWASERIGFEVVSEFPNDLDWVVAHETGHLFGGLDEYKDGAGPDSLGGMYEVKNTNAFPAKDADGCVMRERQGKGVCEVSWNQFGLQKLASGKWRAVEDRAEVRYDFDDKFFRVAGGIIMPHSTIRKGGELVIEVTGKARMHPSHAEFGPEGNPKILGDGNHSLPGAPLGCVIGRWMSLDGKTVGPWFKIGAKSTQTAPYQAYLIWNVNDNRNTFKDNSGSMKVRLLSKLQHQMGEPWERRFTRAEDMMEAETADIGLSEAPEPAAV